MRITLMIAAANAFNMPDATKSLLSRNILAENVVRNCKPIVIP